MPGWTTPSRCIKTLTQHWSAPLQWWIMSLAAPGTLWQFLYITTFSISLAINSSGKIKTHVKICFSGAVSAFQSLCNDRFWSQVLYSHPTNTKTMHMEFLYNPKWQQNSNNTLQLNHQLTLPIELVHRIAFHGLGNCFDHATSDAKVSAWTS